MLYPEPDQSPDINEAAHSGGGCSDHRGNHLAEYGASQTRGRRIFTGTRSFPPAPNVAQVKPGEYYPDMPEAVPLGKGEMEGI